MNTGTQQKWQRETQSSTYMHRGSPLLPILRALSRRLHRHPSAARTPHSHRPPNLTTINPRTSSIYFRPQTYLLHEHPNRRTVLIHSLNVSKPSQYSLNHSTRQLPFNSWLFQIKIIWIHVSLSCSPTYSRFFSCPISHATYGPT